LKVLEAQACIPPHTPVHRRAIVRAIGPVGGAAKREASGVQTTRKGNDREEQKKYSISRGG